jgi:hypothetical protein
MLITYRRTGGGFSLIMLVAVLVATTLAIVVGATLLIVAVAVGAVVLLTRALLLLPTSWRRPAEPAATPWPQETIEATIVTPRDSSDARDLLRLDSDKG